MPPLSTRYILLRLFEVGGRSLLLMTLFVSIALKLRGTLVSRADKFKPLGLIDSCGSVIRDTFSHVDFRVEVGGGDVDIGSDSWVILAFIRQLFVL